MSHGAFLGRVESLAADRDAGASELLARLLPELAQALTLGRQTTTAVARIVCAGQPAMAPLWNACASAVSDWAIPGRFAQVRLELERAPASLTRAAAAALADTLHGPVARVVTLSFSASVASALTEVGRRRVLEVICGEGRPRLEGRRMASTLADSGIRVHLCTDAALAAHLSPSAAVVVGADALAPSFWINKVGTLGLASVAYVRGAPVYVVTSRNKAVATALVEQERGPGALGARPGPLGGLDEVWDAPSPGVEVANPVFEAIPSDLATQFLTDIGPISPLDLPAATERFAADIARLLAVLP
ncbi:MAG: hypothetical protein ACT4QD_20790 [Acidobacteriota bacterium]